MNNTKNITTIILAVVVGLIIGYFLFSGGKNSSKATPVEVHSHDAGATTVEEIWTCSMHPQIRQNEAGQCPICGMDLIPVAEAGGNDDPLVLEMTREAVKMANIQTTAIGMDMKNPEKVIRLSGKVQADERLASSQVAHVPGRIEKLYVSFTGEQVYKGQKLATLYSPELITAQRELLEALRLQTVNPGLLEAARNKLRYWKISDETITNIELNGKIQETFTLFANQSGIVTNRRVSVGDYVKKGEALFDLMSLKRVWVLFDAYEDDLPSITLGNKIEFKTPSIPNKVFSTKITFIDPVINPKTRALSIRTEINNSNGLLKPEMFVNGTIQGKTGAKHQLTVPKTAVLWTGKRSVVYVKVPHTEIPSFQFREIELGESLGDNYLVSAGLEAGEEVVTYGNFTIDAAAQLNNQTSMMNRNVSIEGNDQSPILPDYTSDTPMAFKQQLLNLSNAYLMMKDAFVATNATDVNKMAQPIKTALSKMDMSLLKGAAHLYWMDQLNILKAHNEKMATLEDIEALRTQFSFFSDALIKTIKVFGIPEGKLFVEHCPMALDNTGADWLSREAAIKNPYFGDKMLTCGSVEDTLTKTFKNPTGKGSLKAQDD